MVKQLHPAIYKQVYKMHKWYYENDDAKLNALFEYLSLGPVSFNTLEKKLFELPYEKILILLKDVLTTSDFWFTRADFQIQRNYEIEKNNYNRRRFEHSLLGSYFNTEPLQPTIEEHKFWGEELKNLLKTKCGIIYNEESKTLTIQSHHDSIVFAPLPLKTEPLIKIKFSDQFFIQLVNEINGTFMIGYFTSCLILLRKLFENLFILLLENKYSKASLHLYYEVSKGRYKQFSELIDVLNTKKMDFITNEKNIERLINYTKSLKDNANPTTHLYTYIAHIEDIENIKVMEALGLFQKISNDIGIKIYFNIKLKSLKFVLVYLKRYNEY